MAHATVAYMRANQQAPADKLVPFSTLLPASVLQAFKVKVVRDGGKVYEHATAAFRTYTLVKKERTK